MLRVLIGALMISLCSGACKYEAKSEAEVIAYCNELKNGVRVKVERGDLTMEFIYRPVELIIAQEIKGFSLSPIEIDSVRSLYAKMDYFLLRISKHQTEIETSYANEPTKFNQVNNYLAFGIASDLKLVNEKDTLPAKSAIHTRTFGSSSSTDLLVAFESSLKSRRGTSSLIFDDHMFESGLHSIEFETADIRSIPSLDLTKNNL